MTSPTHTSTVELTRQNHCKTQYFDDFQAPRSRTSSLFMEKGLVQILFFVLSSYSRAILGVLEAVDCPEK